MNWCAFNNPPEIIPLNDLKPHNLSVHCWCRPTEDDGVLIHHSMDQRELYEAGKLKAC